VREEKRREAMGERERSAVCEEGNARKEMMRRKGREQTQRECRWGRRREEEEKEDERERERKRDSIKVGNTRARIEKGR
jgi:hypothetical protein